MVDEVDPDCPETPQPTYQTGNILVLNAGEGQTGSVLCANSAESNDCDLMQLDVQGRLAANALVVGELSSSLLSITAIAGSSAPLICVSSPGTSTCDILRLSSDGVLSLAGKVVADGGFASTSGDVTIGGGVRSETTTTNSLITNSLAVSGTAELNGALNVAGKTRTTSLSVSTELIAEANAKVSLDNLAISAATIDSLTVSSALTVSAPVTFSAPLSVPSLTVSEDLTVLGASLFGTVRATGLIVADAGVASSGNVAVVGSLAISGSVSTGADITVLGSAAVRSLTSAQTISTSALSVSGRGTFGTLSAEQVLTRELSVEERIVAGSIEVDTLQVNGSAVFNSSITAVSVDVGNLTASALAVEGDCILNGVTDIATLSLASLSVGDLSATGTTNLNQVFIASNISVEGRISSSGDILTASSLEVSGALQVHGRTDLRGSVVVADMEAARVSASAISVSDLRSVDMFVTGAASLSSLEVLSAEVLFSGAVVVAGSISATSFKADNAVFRSVSIDVVEAKEATLVSLAVSGDTRMNKLSIGSIESVAGPLQLAGDVDLTGALYVGSVSIIGTLEVGGQSDLSSIATSGPIFSGGSISSAADVIVAGALTSSAITANTSHFISLECNTSSMGRITADILTVILDAEMNGRLFSSQAELTSLHISGDLSVDGAAYFTTTNASEVMYAGGGILSAGDVITTDGAGITCVGPVSISSSLTVAGASNLAAFTASGESTMESLVLMDLNAARISVSGTSVVNELVATGSIEALLGVTSPGDIITTGEGRIATTGVGEIVSAGLMTGKGGVTSPAFVSTTSNGTMFCSGVFATNSSVSIAANLTVGGASVMRGSLNATAILVNTTLVVGGQSTLNGLAASGLIAGNAGIAATSLVSANLTLNSLVVNGLINASSLSVDTAIWTPELRYKSQPVLFSGYSDVFTGVGEVCSLLC